MRSLMDAIRAGGSRRGIDDSLDGSGENHNFESRADVFNLGWSDLFAVTFSVYADGGADERAASWNLSPPLTGDGWQAFCFVGVLFFSIFSSSLSLGVWRKKCLAKIGPSSDGWGRLGREERGGAVKGREGLMIQVKERKSFLISVYVKMIMSEFLLSYFTLLSYSCWMFDRSNPSTTGPTDPLMQKCLAWKDSAVLYEMEKNGPRLDTRAFYFPCIDWMKGLIFYLSLWLFSHFKRAENGRLLTAAASGRRWEDSSAQ